MGILSKIPNINIQVFAEMVFHLAFVYPAEIWASSVRAKSNAFRASGRVIGYEWQEFGFYKLTLGLVCQFLQCPVTWMNELCTYFGC